MAQRYGGETARWTGGSTAAVASAESDATEPPVIGQGAVLRQQAFDHFPFGILVTSPTGSALAWNPLVEQLLGVSLDDHPTALTCCELFGCRQPGTPLESACITELACEAPESLPELRVDLAQEGGAGAVWITAAPMGDNVVLNLRPGGRGDRRRRSEPHWIAGPLIHVHTLGETRIDSAEGRLDGAWLRQRSGQVFKLLLVERHRAVHAEEIAETLWPGGGRTALTNVRHFIHGARHQLEPTRRPRTPSAFIVGRPGGYALDLTRVRVDADEFEAGIEAGRRAFDEGQVDVASQRTARALELYRGDFLADEPYAEWAMAERDRLRALASDGYRLLAEIRLGDRDVIGATAYLERLADIDPFDLDVQRQLITLCLSSGRRSDGLRRFATLRQRLMSAFGEVPDFELADLADDAAAWRLRSEADDQGGPPRRELR